MKKNNIIIALIISIIVFIGIILLVFLGVKNKDNNTNLVNNNHIQEDNEKVYISSQVQFDSSDEYIQWSNDNVTNIVLENKSIKIEKGGIYHITGTIENGTITVDVPDNEDVRLILDNCNISCENFAAINIVEAKKVIISLEEGSENNIEDKGEYANLNEDNEPNATIFSKQDLVINGTGSLNIISKYNNGITCKDGMKIIEGNINVTSVNHGIRGNDYVAINGGMLTVNAQGDGIKSTKGEVLINGGNISITSTQDGIQAETNVIIVGGDINITTGGGSIVSSNNTDSNWGMWENHVKEQSNVEEVSSKGIKAEGSIVISGGNINIDSSDDSIHSNDVINILGGNIEILSGDDGIHSDNSMIIENANIYIGKSYEGIEGLKIDINSGSISIIASDDGINIAGGNDGSSMNGRPGQNMFATNNTNDSYLKITGGEIKIDANGDGIDSNGSIYLTNGEVFVDGPTMSMNGAIDYANKFEITGGTLFAVGSLGMTQAISNTSTIYCLNVTFEKQHEEGSNITIKDSKGNNVISFVSKKQYQSAVIAVPQFKKGESYTVYVDDIKIEDITISSIVNSIGNIGTNNGRGDIPMDFNPRDNPKKHN